jgi:hypothetical protein
MFVVLSFFFFFFFFLTFFDLKSDGLWHHVSSENAIKAVRDSEHAEQAAVKLYEMVENAIRKVVLISALRFLIVQKTKAVFFIRERTRLLELTTR